MIYVILAVVIVYAAFKILLSRPDVSPAKVKELLSNGGKLIDVRTVSEFRNGHIKGAINLPLESLPNGVHRIDISSDTPLLLCCASGMRSGQAKRLLKKAGYTSVLNAGSVSSLNR